MRTRTLAAIGAGLAILVIGATLASAATPDTPYDAIVIPAPDPQPEGRFGDRMKSAGDLNGDGIGDVWIGDYGFDIDGMVNVGRVYAISGRDGNELYHIDSPEPQGQTTPGGFFGFGWSVSNLGDVDGDGVNDLTVGSVRHNVDGNVGQGKAWVFSGAAGRQGDRLLYELNNAEPQAGGAFGWASTAGDIVRADGTPGQDGISEVLVGAFQNDFALEGTPAAAVGPGCGNRPPDQIPAGCRKDQGQAFIFNGAPDVPAEERLVRTLDVPQLDRYVDETGRCVSPNPGPTGQNCGALGIVNEGLGDVNGDGFWDQSVTAWTTGVTAPPAVDSVGRVCYGNPEQRTSPGNGCNERQGRIYVYSGKDGTLLHRIDNPEPQENALFGLQIVEAGAPGDVTGDGHADIYGNGFVQDTAQTDGPAEGKSWVFNGRTGGVEYGLTDPTPEPGGQFGYSLAKTDYDKDGIPDLYIGSSPHHEPGSPQLGGTYVFRGTTGSLLRIFDLPPGDVQVGTADNPGPQLGRGVAAPGDLNGDGEPDYVASAPTYDVDGARNVGRLYAFLSRATPEQPPGQQPPGQQPPPGAGPCGDPAAAGYLHPAKLRVSRARVLREDRRLNVLAPITARAEGDVRVMFHADNRKDTFDANVTEANTVLDEIRILEPITRGQAELGTGIVNLTYLGDEDTRPEFVRLRAASQRAELDVDEMSLIGDRLSARGSVTDRARGVVRFRFSYVDPDGSPNVHEARAEIQGNGDWRLKNDQVPAQLARCGGYLSIQFTGYFPRRIRGEQLAYELNAGQTRRP